MLEIFVARIERLSLLIDRIFAVLADEQHAIDRQIAAALSQGFGDRWIDFHLRMATRPFAAQVIGTDLFHVE